MQALTLQIGIGYTMCAFWTYVGATARLGNALGWSRDDGFYPVPVPLSLMAAWSFLMIFSFGAFFSPAAATSACDELLAAVRQSPPPPPFLLAEVFLTGVPRRLLSCAPYLRSAVPLATRRESCAATRSQNSSSNIFREMNHISRACWTGHTGQPAAD